MKHCTSQLLRFGVISSLALLLLTAQPGNAQEPTTYTGAVVSTSRNTLTIRTTDGQYRLFMFDRSTRKPATITAGSQVRVTSYGEDKDVRSASDIDIIQTANDGAGATSTQVVPSGTRRVEHDIEEESRRFQLGVRAGVALDPELLLIGVQSQIGPFFSKDIYFRPNVEFGYGEVTALFALNPEVVYRLPLSSRHARWSTYFGIGPGFNFLHQNFEQTSGGGKRIDFGEFHSDVGLNILGGIRYRSGMSMELKTTIYSTPSPTLRIIVGYNF